MSQQFVTDAGTLVIPGAYVKTTVQQANSGLATNGILMLVGEADAGPDYSLETNLNLNAFGPDQHADVVAKYKSGNLVDAYNAASAPANDSNIQGAPNRIILVKTNPSAKASSALTHYDASAYGSLYDRSYGKLGNLIYYTITSNTTETLPTTGAFAWIPNIAAINISTRANGDTAQTLTVGALTLPPAFVTAVDALSGVACTGGAERGGGNGILGAVANNLALAIVSGNAVLITFTGTWAVNPAVGDTVYIPSGSAIQGATNKNRGSYIVTAFTANTINCTKLADASGAPAALTAPEAVSSTAVTAVTNIHAYAPVTITLESGNPVDGIGKSLEINDLASNTDLLSNYAWVLSGSTPVKVTWISATGTAVQLTSASEYSVSLNDNRQLDNIQEAIVAGGEIALNIGYSGATASAVVNATSITITVTTGSGTSLGQLNFSDYPTLSDLATFINSKTGYKCTTTTAVLGQLPSSSLDRGTFTFGTNFGNKTGRIKIDAYRFYNKVSANSVLLQLGNPGARAGTGLPQPVTATTYLSGGTKGATTDAIYNAAVDALEQTLGNFVVPLFSRDATTDITDNLTDSASSYTISNIHTYSRTHVLKMSTLKRRRNRQAFLSTKDTFAVDKEKAANMASARCSMTFQDNKAVAQTGGVTQYQPWLGAVVAAGMQAAGFYRAIVHKTPNISGFLQAAADFNDQNDSQMEDALLAGLLPLRTAPDGSINWVSDQTTYGKDDNFVYNSIQAMYVLDIIASTAGQRMEKLFVGQTTAEVSSPVALSALEGIMSDFMRLKLIAASDDAPKGFKNAKITISGTAMKVDAEIKLAGAIYFVPISFLVSQVTQTSSA